MKRLLKKIFDEYNLNFYELFTAEPNVFCIREYPLANKEKVTLDDLKHIYITDLYKGTTNFLIFLEELFSNEEVEKRIRISDCATVVNLKKGLNGYTVSNGVFFLNIYMATPFFL